MLPFRGASLTFWTNPGEASAGQVAWIWLRRCPKITDTQTIGVFALVITNVYWILLDDFEVPPIQETFMFHLVDVLLEKILAFPSLTQSASKSYNSWWPTSIKRCTNPKAAMFFFRSKTRSRDINKTQTSTCRFHTTHGYVKSQDFPNISKPNDPILPSSLKRHLPHLDMRNHGSWER